MLSESKLLDYVSRELGSTLFDILDRNLLIDVLFERTMDVYSSYYPRRLKQATIMAKNCVIVRDPITGNINYGTYKIPNHDPDNVEYIGVYDYYFHNTDRSCLHNSFSSYPNMTASTLTNKLTGLMPHTKNPHTLIFQPPNIVIVDPPPITPISFVISLNLRCRLQDIAYGLEETVLDYYLAEVKNYVYNDMTNLRSSGNYGGIEIEPYISEFSDAKSTMNDIKEKWQADFMFANTNIIESTLYRSN